MIFRLSVIVKILLLRCYLAIMVDQRIAAQFPIAKIQCRSARQAAENTTLTDVLYPSDYHEIGKRIRLKQEFLLVSASLQDIIRHYLEFHDNFRAFAAKFVSKSTTLIQL